MTVFQAIILGTLQGLTEFLPISSSGHLILIPHLIGWEAQSLAFDTVLHIGTASALLVYFWHDILQIVKREKYLKLIALATLPALLVGITLNNIVENSLRSSAYVAFFLMVGSIIMWLAERTYKNVWHKERITDVRRLSIDRIIAIGIFQSIALFSGISRSGSTISGGMLVGLTRESAAKFSFILSIPIVILAGVFKVTDSYKSLNFDLALLAGFLTSFTMGMLAIKFLLRFLQNNNLYVFILYRVVLAFIVISTLF